MKRQPPICNICKDHAYEANAGVLTSIPYWYCRNCKHEVNDQGIPQVEIKTYVTGSQVVIRVGDKEIKPVGPVEFSFDPGHPLGQAEEAYIEEDGERKTLVIRGKLTEEGKEWLRKQAKEDLDDYLKEKCEELEAEDEEDLFPYAGQYPIVFELKSSPIEEERLAYFQRLFREMMESSPIVYKTPIITSIE